MKTITERKGRAEPEGRRPKPPEPPRRGIPVDLRIRRRQIDVRRAEGRRRLRLLSGALALAVLVAGGWAATRTPLFDVDRVLVDGAVHTPAEEVRAVANVALGGAMTGIDGSEVSRRLSRLAWVQRTEVRREWPGTVRIRVVERSAAAVTRDDTGRWALVDRTARVLERPPAPPPGLLVVEGLSAAGTPGTHLAAGASDALAAAASMPPGLAPRVMTVVVAPAGGVELRLSPRGVVRLGTAEGIGDKLRAAHTVLGAVDPNTVAVLDVRVPHTPVLTRG